MNKSEFNICQARISDVMALLSFYTNLDEETRYFYKFLLCDNAFKKIVSFLYLFLRIILNEMIYLIRKRYLLMLLLFYQSNVVGECHISISGHSGTYGIVIDKKYRGKGLSYILSQKAILSAAKHGVKRLILAVHEDNIRAINLYKKLNFRSVGIRWDTRRVNGKRVPIRVIIMERNLDTEKS